MVTEEAVLNGAVKTKKKMHPVGHLGVHVKGGINISLKTFFRNNNLKVGGAKTSGSPITYHFASAK